MLVNSSQAIVAKYLYDAFGNVLSKSGLLANANVYQFSSKEMHLNSGLVYYLYRFYDPNLQRWLNGDPLGDYGSVVYVITSTELRTPDEIALVAAAVRDPLAVFTRINLNLHGAMINDPVDQSDPEGLYGFWNGLWDEFTDPNGYTACYARCMLGFGLTSHIGSEFGGATYAARKWYSWKYPRWFKAGGKYSKKLVPKLAGKLNVCLAPLVAIDVWDCYNQCKDRQ
jgi:RHS repeat-associated protein